MPKIAKRVATMPTTVFTEINELATQHNALNLGQGRPDFDAPPQITNAAVEALQSGTVNQYAPGQGSPRLRDAVVDHTRRFYDIDLNPATDVIVTSGATEGVFSSILGTVDAGDEVIIIEPYFDSYVPNVKWVEATPVYVPLRPPEWGFDADELRAAFSPKTKAILVNSPQNPTGRVFTYDEQKLIADLCQEYDAICISDEVYEHLTFGDAQHIPMAQMPGMAERTVTVSSAGKSFSVTGWKIGWVFGATALMKGVWLAHQFVTFASNYPTQEATAFALCQPDDYFTDFKAMYTRKRDLIMEALTNAGLKPALPQGTYFVMADFSDVFDGNDMEFAKYLTAEIGVACIPPTAFYSPEHKHMAEKQARFAFCKSDETLIAAGERMAKLKK